MASFSQRHGYKEVRSVVQREDLDRETRMGLWNVVAILPTVFGKTSNDDTETKVLDAFWLWELKKPRDERPHNSVIWRLVKQEILTSEWWVAFDTLELLVRNLDRHATMSMSNLGRTLVEAINDMLEHHLVGHRFIGNQLTPIDSASEAEAIGLAIEAAVSIAGARHHLERATELLADRQNPDYPNTIKESISAVESIVKKVTGEGTLGAGLKKIEGSGLIIHPALKDAWSKMYGWTSDEDGIRHGGIKAADARQELAKYVLVTCSAFVSYLIESGRKTGLLED